MTGLSYGGDFSVVDACWRSIIWMLEHIDFGWLILLSAQDYPIKPLALLADKLRATDSDAIIDARPVRDFSAEADLSRRYLFQYSRASERQSGSLRYQLRRGSEFIVDVINDSQRLTHIYTISPGSSISTRTPPCWTRLMSSWRRRAPGQPDKACHRPHRAGTRDHGTEKDTCGADGPGPRST